jgi:hypothetical protein
MAAKQRSNALIVEANTAIMLAEVERRYRNPWRPLAGLVLRRPAALRARRYGSAASRGV